MPRQLCGLQSDPQAHARGSAGGGRGGGCRLSLLPVVYVAAGILITAIGDDTWAPAAGVESSRLKYEKDIVRAYMCAPNGAPPLGAGPGSCVVSVYSLLKRNATALRAPARGQADSATGDYGLRHTGHT